MVLFFRINPKLFSPVKKTLHSFLYNSILQMMVSFMEVSHYLLKIVKVLSATRIENFRVVHVDAIYSYPGLKLFFSPT